MMIHKMTCNDCLHWEACRNLIEAINPDYKGKNIVIHSVCEKFKNKADYAEVKHGEWMPIDVEQISFGCIDEATIYKCSACGRYENEQEPYCNCGAKMDGRSNA